MVHLPSNLARARNAVRLNGQDYGADTKQLLRKLRTSQSYLSITGLQIHSLPPLSGDLQLLYCEQTQITRLPELPNRLRSLECSGTPMTSLPELPPSLLVLGISNTKIKVLPRLPSALQELYCINTPLLIQMEEGESIDSYRARWDAWWDEQDRLAEEAASMGRVQSRCRELRQDLMAEIWHPRRVEKWIEAGCWDILD
jgi:Leucine-rich repeat (LRR) protein